MIVLRRVAALPLLLTMDVLARAVAVLLKEPK